MAEDRKRNTRVLNGKECPECGAEGPHEDNGETGEQLSYCCKVCGAHWDASDWAPDGSASLSGLVRLMPVKAYRLEYWAHELDEKPERIVGYTLDAQVAEKWRDACSEVRGFTSFEAVLDPEGNLFMLSKVCESGSMERDLTLNQDLKTANLYESVEREIAAMMAEPTWQREPPAPRPDVGGYE